MHRRIGLSAAIGVQSIGNQRHYKTSGQCAAAATNTNTDTNFFRVNNIRNESVQKTIINNTIEIGILVFSNDNSFWVLFDEIASAYFIWKNI